MSAWVKFAIGLAAVLALGWLTHGPLGRGEALLSHMEAQARSQIAESGVPGIMVVMERDPLTRTAILSGPANSFQREGQGSFPGLNERVLSVPGVGGVRWLNPAAS